MTNQGQAALGTIQKQKLPAIQRIFGGSEMAEQIRSFDWSKTMLGPIHLWPETLLSTVNLILASPQPMLIWWGKTLLQFYNDALRETLGQERQASALGQSGPECWPETWEQLKPQVEAALVLGIPTKKENHRFEIYRDGILQEIYCTYRYSPIRDAFGTIRGVLAISTETTAQVLAGREQQRLSNQKLLESQQQFAVILDALPALVACVDTDLKYITMNAAYEEWFGIGRESCIGHHVSEILGESAPSVLGHLQLALEGFPQEFECKLRTRQGIRDVSIRHIPRMDEERKVSFLVVHAVDITQRKQIEEKIIESRQQLHVALEAGDLATWYYDPDRYVVGGDAKMRSLFGISAPEAPLDLWFSALCEEDRDRVRREFETSLQGSPYDTEYCVRKDGDVRWLHIRGRLLGKGNTPNRMVGICEDITERKLEREEAERQRAEIETVYRTAPIGLALFDTEDFRYLRLNDRQAAFFGLKPEQVVGRTLTEMAPIEGLRELFEQVLRGEPVVNFPLEGTLITDPTDYRYWTVSYFPVLNSDGAVRAITASSLEITQQKKAEKALIESEKLAVVGRLAASIAHEINNPLESMTNLLYLAQLSDTMEEVKTYLQTAERELRRVAAISNQTLRFHKQSTSPQAVTCRDLIESVLSMYQGRIVNSQVQVIERQRAHQPVRCFEGEIRQVLSNAISNAIDAMQTEGGLLYVRSRIGTKWKTGEKGVVLTIADTGMGMSAAVRKRAFEPFYTTKGMVGTGLGLWVSQDIANRHNGCIWLRSCQSPKGSGTVFVLFLPFEAVSRF